MVKTIESPPGVGEQAGDAFGALHEALGVLQLAAYAADAMRVLNTLQRRADQCPAFDQRIKSVCANWRNPGSLNDPADLIAETLLQVTSTMRRILNDQPTSHVAGARGPVSMA